MTDAEILCEFMEPEVEALHDSGRSKGGWWVRERSDVMGCVYVGPWRPRKITLNECRLIEAKLTDEQWWEYETQLRAIPYAGPISNAIRCAAHADAPTKIKALAAVLGAERKARGGQDAE